MTHPKGESTGDTENRKLIDIVIPVSAVIEVMIARSQRAAQAQL